MSAAVALMTASAARAASGNPDEPAQGAANGEDPGSRTDPDAESSISRKEEPMI